MRKMCDLKCNRCDLVDRDRYVDVDKLPPHEHCGGKWERAFLPGNANGVIPDDIPGGLLINNLLCDSEGNPQKWYSKSAIKRAAAEKGYIWGTTRHTPGRGGDKSKHTTRWV